MRVCSTRSTLTATRRLVERRAVVADRSTQTLSTRRTAATVTQAVRAPGRIAGAPRASPTLGVDLLLFVVLAERPVVAYEVHAGRPDAATELLRAVQSTVQREVLYSAPPCSPPSCI